MRRSTVGRLSTAFCISAREAHAQTFVKLVDDEPPHAVRREVELVYMVVEASRRGEHYLRTGAHDGAVLVHGGAAAVEACRAHAAAHALEHFVRLQGEFAARHYHHHLHLVVLRVHAACYGQAVGECLAAARRCEHHYVAVGVQHGVHRVLLHGVQLVNAELSEAIFYIHSFYVVFFVSLFYWTFGNPEVEVCCSACESRFSFCGRRGFSSSVGGVCGMH